MGQGCSSDLGLFVNTKKRAARYAESPDLVMREIARASVSTVQALRRRAHAEHFGTKTSTSFVDNATNRPLDARPIGQEHLLFHNLEKAANNNNSNSNSLREISSSDHKSHKLRGGRRRKIAESFEASVMFNSVTPEEILTASSHRQHRKGKAVSNYYVSEAAVEAFDVTLSEEIARVCPTRLWIRRRTFPKRHRMRPKNKKPQSSSSLQKEQRPLDQNVPEPPQVVLLEEGKTYHRKHDYFGLGKPPEPPIPNVPAQASTHIYAVRYSPDGCQQFAMPNSSKDTSHTKEESPPYWIPITNDEASVNNMFSPANMALPPERDGTLQMIDIWCY